MELYNEDWRLFPWKTFLSKLYSKQKKNLIEMMKTQSPNYKRRLLVIFSTKFKFINFIINSAFLIFFLSLPISEETYNSNIHKKMENDEKQTSDLNLLMASEPFDETFLNHLEIVCSLNKSYTLKFFSEWFSSTFNIVDMIERWWHRKWNSSETLQW